jgi:hypothetical protein
LGERGREPDDEGWAQARRATPQYARQRRPSPSLDLERNDDTQFDAEYRQWREEQMRLLDRDYAQWRQERYRKFAEEFSQWRSQRLRAGAATQCMSETSDSLGERSPLGTPPTASPLQGTDQPQERERSNGGLLGSLLGGHGERHKPSP